MPREITHRKKLHDISAELAGFLDQATSLGDRLGPILIQLPPSLVFDAETAISFFGELRRVFHGQVVFEPRHGSWFAGPVERLLVEHDVARVAADPPPVPEARTPGGFSGLRYYRLHGSPRIYYSAYDEAFLRAIAAEIGASQVPTWVILDNTALGFAAGDAMRLQQLTSP